MKFLLSVFFVLALAISSAHAREHDLIILDEDDAAETAETNAIIDFLQRHVSVAGGGYWAGGFGAFQSSFGFVSASFDYPFSLFYGNGRILVTGGYSYRDVDLTLEFEEDSRFILGPDADVDRTAPNDLVKS